MSISDEIVESIISLCEGETETDAEIVQDHLDGYFNDYRAEVLQKLKEKGFSVIE